MPILNMVYYAAEWGGWWKPWANTLAYLPLSTDANDHKWFWTALNWTTNNITFSDSKAVFNSSGTSCIYWDDTTLPTNFTLHMIVKFGSVWVNNYQVLWRHSDSSWYDNSRCYPTGYYEGINFALCWANDQTSLAYPDTTNEHLYSVVIQPSWSTQTQMDFYVDGVNKFTTTKNNQTYSNSKLALWNRWYNMNEWIKSWTMREVILESSYWTADEVLALAKQFWFA